MKKIYPSKNAKRKAEALERKKKRDAERKQFQGLDEDETIEEMAARLGVRLN